MRDGAALCSLSVAEGRSGPDVVATAPHVRFRRSPLRMTQKKNPAEPPQIINSVTHYAAESLS